MDLTGDDLICSSSQGGCGEPFSHGSRAFILTSRQVQKIKISDGDIPFIDFETSSGMFCENCINQLKEHGGILTRHCPRGEYMVSFSWVMKRTQH